MLLNFNTLYSRCITNWSINVQNRMSLSTTQHTYTRICPHSALSPQYMTQEVTSTHTHSHDACSLVPTTHHQVYLPSRVIIAGHKEWFNLHLAASDTSICLLWQYVSGSQQAAKVTYISLWFTNKCDIQNRHLCYNLHMSDLNPVCEEFLYQWFTDTQWQTSYITCQPGNPYICWWPRAGGLSVLARESTTKIYMHTLFYNM